MENKYGEECKGDSRFVADCRKLQSIYLFCPLRQMLEKSPEIATQVIKVALPDYPIHIVKDVDLEFIPVNYKCLTGDKSAMDAIIRFEDWGYQ